MYVDRPTTLPIYLYMFRRYKLIGQDSLKEAKQRRSTVRFIIQAFQQIANRDSENDLLEDCSRRLASGTSYVPVLQGLFLARE